MTGIGRSIPSAPEGASKLSRRPLPRTLLAALLVLLPTPAVAAGRVQPEDFTYLGAFRLPVGGERPDTFAWGANAMTFYPGGDPAGAGDGHPGSLFLSGHDRMAYGELPDGGKLAEVSIPAPVRAKSADALPRAEFLQGFADVAAGKFSGQDELPRMGLQYLDAPGTGAKLHIAWGAHFEPDPPIATHGAIGLDLENPGFAGPWFIGDATPYAVNDYMFEIPADWAAAHVGGRMLATGRYRDGGWSGMGPSLFAYRPWSDDGALAAPETRLEAVALLSYESSRDTESFARAMKGYQHADQWTGGAWLTTASGKSAVLFAGTKAMGKKFWYGFVHPQGAELPCPHAESVAQYTACRLADGSPCPASDLAECAGHNDARGWWSSAYDAQFVLYDPDDFSAVAAGTLKPWQPQPYATLSIDEMLFYRTAGWNDDYIGRGPQREYRVDSLAYDRAGGFLYLIEPFVDEDRPIVHVWQVM